MITRRSNRFTIILLFSMNLICESTGSAELVINRLGITQLGDSASKTEMLVFVNCFK